jgi:molybdenum cofactor guanylyltransferase
MNETVKHISAFILAGGKSSRMKTEKGLLFFNNKMLVEHVIDKLKIITHNVYFITSNTSYQVFGFPCFEDLKKEKGALGGIYTALENSSSQKNLIVACDMPFLSEKLLTELVNSAGDEDVLLTYHKGMPEPLCSVYDKNCITHIRSLLEKNQLKITDAFYELKTRVISFDDAPWFRGNEFVNMNSIEELNKYKS